jgi:DNA-directed RNA polymerase subunit H (RpoH/RPB5)
MTTTSTNSHIISIYNSRTILLDILEERGFNVDDYKNFSISEIGILLESNQLDMLMEDNNKKKIYVKYYVTKVLKAQNIYSFIEDLIHLENILSKTDDLMIIIKDEPNDTLIQTVKDIYMEENIYVALVNIKRLQFNILKHELVPKHTVLTNEEANAMKKKYNILDDSQIPDISYFSPISIILGIRPNNIVKIERNSRTAIKSDFYRICKI